MKTFAQMEEEAADLNWRDRFYKNSVLYDPKLLGVTKDGKAIYEIAGGMDGPFFRDMALARVPNTADLGNITLATTQKMLWAPGSTSPTIIPSNYWWAGKTVKITANLKWTAVANTNGITVGMAYGSADAATPNVVATAITPVSSTSVFDVFIQGYATCRSTGTAGTLSMWGVCFTPIGLSVNSPATFPSGGTTVVSTIDTTVATNGIYFQAARATAAGDTVAVTNLIMEALN